MPRLAIYAAGSNSHGQLGTGSRDDAHGFTRCPLNLNVSLPRDAEAKIVAGANHTLLLIKDSGKTRLLAAGSSKQGQLGKKEEVTRVSFETLDVRELLPNLPSSESQSIRADYASWTVLDIAAGWETSFILLGNDGESVLLALGSNDFGQLGVVPKGTTANVLEQKPHNTLRSISAGSRHCVAIDTDGGAWIWGAARQGQLGTSTLPSICSHPHRLPESDSDGYKVMAVAVGQQHTVVLEQRGEHEDLEVHTYGNNKYGQLGIADPKARKHAMQVSDLETSASKAAVYATWNSTFIQLVESSRLYSFGQNAHGQLGRPEESHFGAVASVMLPQYCRILQVSAGSEHVVALLETESGREVWGWGWNEHGNLGLHDGKLEDIRLPTKLWSPSRPEESIHSVHAGNGTSWIVTLRDEPDG